MRLTYPRVKEQFLTVGELSQVKIDKTSAKLAKLASKYFTSSYLPLNTLYRFPRDENDKREKDNDNATIPGGHPYSYNRLFP